MHCLVVLLLAVACFLQEADSRDNSLKCIDKDKALCLKTLTERVDYCKTWEAFQECGSTCLGCGELKDKRCPELAPVENADRGLMKGVEHPGQSDWAPGMYYKYTCHAGYELESGDLGRACTGYGTVTGAPPVCKPIVVP